MRSEILNQIEAATIKEHIPFSVLIEVTHRCNLKCTHCYLDLADRSAIPKELSLEEIKDILDQLADAGTFSVIFTGGEVFLRKDFLDMVAYARSKNISVRILTNGTLITERIANALQELSPTSVEISVLGGNRDTHEQITAIPKSYNRAISALKLLRERGIHTVMKTPLMKQNVREYQEIKALAEELGASSRMDPTISPKSSGATGPVETHGMSEDDLFEIFSHPDFASSDPSGNPLEIPILKDPYDDSRTSDTSVDSKGGMDSRKASVAPFKGEMKHSSLLQIQGVESQNHSSTPCNGGDPIATSCPSCNRSDGLILQDMEDQDDDSVAPFKGEMKHSSLLQIQGVESQNHSSTPCNGGDPIATSCPSCDCSDNTILQDVKSQGDSLPTLCNGGIDHIPSEKHPDDYSDRLCNAGQNMCAISPYGEVRPCVQLYLSVGNLRKDPFDKIWHSKKLQEIRSLRFSDLPVCSKCSLQEYCSRCSGLALLETGDIFSPSSIACQEAKVKKKIADSGKNYTPAFKG